MPRRILPAFLILLLATVLFLHFFIGGEPVFALPEIAEWKTGDFSIEIKDWDNPLGIEGKDNSGLNKDTCTYKVESLNPITGLWEVTRTATIRTCATPIPITVGLKTGEGYKDTTDIRVQTTDCKYSGENACRITAWAQDYASNNSFGTEYMLTRIYSIDFGPPTVTIGVVRRTTPDPKTIIGNWLKAGIYEISVTDTDNDEGSNNIDTNACTYTVRDRGADGEFGLHPIAGVDDDRKYTSTRTCSDKIYISVGPPEYSVNDCVTQGDQFNCRIELTARDKAGNPITLFKLFKVDYTAPHAQ